MQVGERGRNKPILYSLSAKNKKKKKTFEYIASTSFHRTPFISTSKFLKPCMSFCSSRYWNLNLLPEPAVHIRSHWTTGTNGELCPFCWPICTPSCRCNVYSCDSFSALERLVRWSADDRPPANDRVFLREQSIVCHDARSALSVLNSKMWSAVSSRQSKCSVRTILDCTFFVFSFHGEPWALHDAQFQKQKQKTKNKNTLSTERVQGPCKAKIGLLSHTHNMPFTMVSINMYFQEWLGYVICICTCIHVVWGQHFSGTQTLRVTVLRKHDPLYSVWVPRSNWCLTIYDKFTHQTNVKQHQAWKSQHLQVIPGVTKPLHSEIMSVFLWSVNVFNYYNDFNSQRPLRSRCPRHSLNVTSASHKSALTPCTKWVHAGGHLVVTTFGN